MLAETCRRNNNNNIHVHKQMCNSVEMFVFLLTSVRSLLLLREIPAISEDGEVLQHFPAVIGN